MEISGNRESSRIKKFTLRPDSERYLEIKKACLDGDYLNHFFEHDFHEFDNADQLYLYEYVSDDYDVQKAYQMYLDDLPLFENKVCIILFNVSDGGVMMDDLNIVHDTFKNIGLTLMFGVKKKVEILFLCC